MSFLSLCGFGLVEGVVGGTDQWARFNVLESHLFAEVFVFGKFVGMNEANYGQMIFCWLQILAEGEDVCALGG